MSFSLKRLIGMPCSVHIDSDEDGKRLVQVLEAIRDEVASVIESRTFVLSYLRRGCLVVSAWNSRVPNGHECWDVVCSLTNVTNCWTNVLGDDDEGVRAFAGNMQVWLNRQSNLCQKISVHHLDCLPEAKQLRAHIGRTSSTHWFKEAVHRGLVKT